MSLRVVFFDVKTLSMTKMQVAGYRLAFIALALNMLTWLLPVLANSADGGFLSICTAKGIQVIKVTDNGFPDNAPEPLSDDNTRSQNCAFCFAQSAAFTPVTGVSVYSTETVYGLGADATNGEAIAKIFEAKNRPSFNPLIVHIAKKDNPEKYVVMNEQAKLLASYFWPGALTMILPRQKDCPISELWG